MTSWFAAFDPIAHRGGAHEAPENTLAAFRHAWELGFRYFESDVRVTSDGVALAFHDATLDRTTDAHGLVRDHSEAQLRGVRHRGGEPLVPLAELIDAFPDVRFNLDVKEAAAIRPFIDVLAATNAWHRVVAGSFSHRRLTEVRRFGGPRVATSMSPNEVAAMVLAALGRGRRWSPAPAVCAQIPPRFAGRDLLHSRVVGLARAAGVPLQIWTIDDEAEMERLLDLEVAGIMTDRPTVLRAVLRRRGQWGGR